MNESIYAPPEADVGDALSDEDPYYVVGTRKFYLLSLMTFTLYIVYWFYRNWRSIKLNNREDIWPVPRALFYIFFTHSLLTDVNERLKTVGSDFQWRPGAIAGLFVAIVILSNVLSNLADRSIGSPATDLISMALLPLIPFIMLKAQRAINIASDDPDGSSNQGLTVINWVWLVLGFLGWLLVLVGLYLTLFAPELLVE